MMQTTELLFSIDSFQIERYSNRTTKTPVRKDRVNFQIQHQFKVNADDSIFQVGFRIQVTDGKQNKQELASIETITSFKIKGLEPQDFGLIPEHLVTTCLSIAYSTTRGALIAKSQGTIAGEVPLPLINPSEVIKQTGIHP